MITQDRGLSCCARTDYICLLKITLKKSLLARNVRGFCVVTIRIKEKHSGICFSGKVLQVVIHIMGTRGRPHRFELGNTKLVDRYAKQLFQQAGWYQFLSKFSGENYGVARRFAESYDGNKVVIGSLSFVVNSEFISEATILPQIGEPWFKGKMVLAMDFNMFLKEEFRDPDWKNGIPTKWLKEEWHGTVEVIQRYITCDFHFTRATVYLMRFLGHLAGVKKLNLVNFLHKYLSRMSYKIQAKPSLKHWHVFHKGLIKILVSHYVCKINKTWDEFIRTEGFEGMNISRVKERPPKTPHDSSANKQPSTKTGISLSPQEPPLEKREKLGSPRC